MTTFSTDKTLIKQILEKSNVRGVYTINDDGVVDLPGNFVLSDEFINDAVLPIRFGKVSGVFSVSGSDLTTLEGCPLEAGEFTCSSSSLLTSLKGCPLYVK